jgi:hypothetical protein
MRLPGKIPGRDSGPESPGKYFPAWTSRQNFQKGLRAVCLHPLNRTKGSTQRRGRANLDIAKGWTCPHQNSRTKSSSLP